MLSTLIGLPVLGAAIVGFWPGNIAATRLRSIAVAIASAILLVTIWVATQFDVTNSGLQFQEYLPWIPQIGLTFKLGVDGLSFPLLALSSLLNLIVIFSSRIAVDRVRLKYALILLVNAAVAGAFLAQNLLLFFLFYELILIPLYLLIAIWGGQRRGYAATKFLLYTAVSGALILAAFLGVVFLSGASSFAYTQNAELASLLPVGKQLLLL